MTDWIIRTANSIYEFLLPFTGYSFWIIILLLPVLFWRKARGTIGWVYIFSSYLIGVTGWLLGLITTGLSFGGIGILIGTVFGIVGVVPLGIVGAYWNLDNGDLAMTLLRIAIWAIVVRLVGRYLVGEEARHSAEESA
jgi:hypothetical protein